jgi:protocatechuate 3,4-dioxygenase beta subunit
MYVEGRVLTTGGEPISGAVIDTWETDSTGERHFEMHVPSGLTTDVWVRRVAFQPRTGTLGKYELEYAERTAPECRGRLRTDEEGKYGYRAIVPVPYCVPHDVWSSHFVFHAFVTIQRMIGSGGRAASHLATTQRPAESPPRGDRSPRIPQAHDGAVPRG